jgi:hypothetical protein
MSLILAAALLLQAQGDGYPASTSTPEGAACDLARAFKDLDSKLFRSTCIEPLGAGKSSEDYGKFLANVVVKMDKDQKADAKPDGVPKKITKVFKARHLSKNGPGSTAYALYDLPDVMFVDVVTERSNGSSFNCRTLVFQLNDKSWRVLPRPDLYPLLSAGLNEESESTEQLPRKE